MKSYKTFVKDSNKKTKHKTNRVNDGEDKPGNFEFIASEDEYLHEPGDTGISNVG